MQTAASRPSGLRSQRTTTSCTECRRRKQRCDLAQPCSNCFRRYPRPACEYKHKNPNGRQQTQGLPNMLVFSATADPEALAVPPKVLSQGSTPGPSGSIPDSGTTPTQGKDARQWEVFSWMSQPARVTPSPPSSRSTRGGRAPSHAESRQELEEPLGAEDGEREEPAIEREPAFRESLARANLWQLAGPVAEISTLPIKATRENAMLIKIFIHHLYRFKGSLDGYPDPDNPFIEHYVPWFLHSPLLMRVSLCVAATSLIQLKRMDKTAAMALKVQAIRTLNEYLRSDAATSDEAISAVSQLILNDWYFGETGDMQAHLSGLREMVRLRGGFAKLGVKGIVSKSAIATDCFIAISLETAPLHQHGFLDAGPEFDLWEDLPDRLNPSFNTPFVSNALFPTFASSKSLNLHPATARILDDIRFLFSIILKLPADPSKQDIEKLLYTAKWVHDRIGNLPDICPDAPQTSPPPPAMISPASTLPSQGPSPRSDSDLDSSRGSMSGAPSSSSGDSPASRSNLPGSISSAAPTPSIKPTEIPASVPAITTPQSHDPSHYLLHSQTASLQLTPFPPDFLYATVRLTALIYTRATLARADLSTVCPPNYFMLLWSTAWRVPLRTWHSVLGVFLWMIIAILPTASATPFATFVKSMLHIGSVQIGLDHWGVCREMLHSALRIQAWLRGGREGGVVAGGAGAGAMGMQDVMDENIL